MLRKALNILQKNRNYSPYLKLFIFALIAYSPVLSYNYTPIWDMIDCYLPWRYFVSECIKANEFPLWNPYNNMGYPIHADLRSTWYPLIWILGGTVGYSVFTFNILIFLYAFIGGCGIYNFTKKIYNTSEKGSILTALAYMLSGYYVAHLQELSGMVSFAFIPFVLLNYLRLKNLHQTLKTAFFTILVILGGYQAHTIILLYLLFFVFIFHTVQLIISKNYSELKKYILNNTILALLLSAMSSMLFISLNQAMPYLSRFSGLSFESVAGQAFNKDAFLSFILPFATVGKADFFSTDITMRNAYIGLLPLILLISNIRRRKKGIHHLFFYFGILCLLAAMGDVFALRRFLYDYVPLMDKFRSTSFFIYFSLLLFLPFIALEFDNLQTKGKNSLRIVLGISLSFFVLILVIWYLSTEEVYVSDLILNKLRNKSFYELLNELTYYEHIFIQGVFQLGIMAIILFLLSRKERINKFAVPLVAVDLIFSVWFNIFHTGLLYDCTVAETQKFINKQPKGFPKPNINKRMAEFNDVNSSFRPLWRNCCIFSKTTGYNGFNSFQLDNYNLLFEDNKRLSDSLLQKPLLFISHKLKAYDKDTSIVDAEAIYTDKKTFENTSITQYPETTDKKIDILKFSPDKIELNVKTASSGWLNLQQTYYPGWQAIVNGKKTRIIKSNFLTFSIFVPKGKSTVVFEYDNPLIRYSFYLYAFVFVSICISLIVILISKKH